MTAAFQPRTNGPAHQGGSRFFASPPRAPRHRHSRPANRRADRKTAPGIFFAAPPKTRLETVSQVTNTHQESTTCVFVFAPGCAVGPNNTGGRDLIVTYGKQVGGSIALPGIGILGGGGQASASVSLAFDVDHPLNSRLQISVSGGPLVTAGGALYAGTGDVEGVSVANLQTGISPTTVTTHIEGGAGGFPGTPPLVASASLDLDLKSGVQISNPALVAPQLGERINVGAAIYIGAGPNYTKTYTSPSLGDIINYFSN